MNESEGTGTLEERGGRYTSRFERFLGHSRERVWRAITSEDDLSAWFPARMVGEREVGAALRFVFPEPGRTPTDSDEGGLVMTGEALVWDPPGVLEHRWDGDVLRWELEERPGGTLLTFTHTFDDQGRAAWDAAGWDHCFASLEACLGGSPVEPFTWERHNDRLARYARRFGPEGAVQRRPTPVDELAFASLESTEDT